MISPASPVTLPLPESVIMNVGGIGVNVGVGGIGVGVNVGVGVGVGVEGTGVGVLVGVGEMTNCTCDAPLLAPCVKEHTAPCPEHGDEEPLFQAEKMYPPPPVAVAVTACPLVTA